MLSNCLCSIHRVILPFIEIYFSLLLFLRHYGINIWPNLLKFWGCWKAWSKIQHRVFFNETPSPTEMLIPNCFLTMVTAHGQAQCHQSRKDFTGFSNALGSLHIIVKEKQNGTQDTNGFSLTGNIKLGIKHT